MKQSNILNVVFAIFISFTALNTQALQAETLPGQVNINLVRKGNYAYSNSNYAIAASYYETYFSKKNEKTGDAAIKLADCYWQMREYDKAHDIYNQLFSSAQEVPDQKLQYRIAELNARLSKYEQAANWLKGIDTYKIKADTYESKIKIDSMKKDSLKWEVTMLSINTGYREFSPFIKDSLMFFSSNKQLTTSQKSFGFDGKNYAHLWKIPISDIKSDSKIDFSSGGQIINQSSSTKKLSNVYELSDVYLHDGAIRSTMEKITTSANQNPIGSLVQGLNKINFNSGTIAMDNQNNVYFSSNFPKADKSGIYRLGIMEGKYSSSIGVNYTKFLPFGDAKEYSAMHPTVNPEGTLLVFSSDKPGGKGGYDLYYSQRNSPSELWGSALAFPDNINTAGNEVFATLTSNSELLFSSDWLPGLGGLDIYYISLKDALEGKQTPKHFSYPVNSSADDFGMTQTNNGLSGYFTSDRLNSNDNIYQYNYQKPLKNGKYYIQSLVVDNKSKKPVKDATVFLLNESSSKVNVGKTDTKGLCKFLIQSSGQYIVKVVEKNHSSNCVPMNVNLKPSEKDSIINSPSVTLDLFKVGFKWKLDNIHYDYDMANIRDDAKPILDSVLFVLNKFPIKIELSSHTDSRGSATYNDKLSQLRADSAVAYLVQNGIDQDRITAKGYGERQLSNRCEDGVNCSEEEHQENRRTEVKVTGLTDEGNKQEINPDKFINGDNLEKKKLPDGFFDKCL